MNVTNEALGLVLTGDLGKAVDSLSAFNFELAMDPFSEHFTLTLDSGNIELAFDGESYKFQWAKSTLESVRPGLYPKTTKGMESLISELTVDYCAELSRRAQNRLIADDLSLSSADFFNQRYDANAASLSVEDITILAEEYDQLRALVTDLLEERGSKWDFIFPRGTDESMDFLYGEEGFKLITSGKCKLKSEVLDETVTLSLDVLRKARDHAINKKPSVKVIDGDNSWIMLGLVEEYLFNGE